MRLTSTAKFFFLFLLGLAAAVLITLYFVMHQPQLAKIIGSVLMGIFLCFLAYVTLAPIVSGLGERADGVLAVYPDASGKALHIFSYFLTSAEGFASTRHIQYYLLLTENRRLHYKVLFGHSMEPASGRSGYEGYSSFEENVPGGLEFKAAIAEYSAKAGWQLELGEAVAPGNDDSYAALLNGYTYKIENRERMVRDVMKLCCYDGEEKMIWRKNI